MELYWPYFFADYYRALEYFTVAIALVILISGIDDLFVDAVFYTRTIKRHFTVKRRYKPLTPDQLMNRPEQHIAIMVPAWMESDVIAAMIEGIVGVLDYRNYTVFVGTYRNDKATIDEVERMRRRYRQLVRVEVPNDGPTCKADCLNWVVQAIFAHETAHGIQFAGSILHDSEDVLHPLELRFFNYLLPRIDLIQIPVNSLERNWYDLVAGVYMDEFAEWHSKDIAVRETLTGMVPSAGVGTCFSRKALLTLSQESDNQPFNTQTLTEDYDIGVRLAKHGMRSIMARFMVDYHVTRKTWFGLGKTKDITFKMPLCVQEYFPKTFRTSYRQKARWCLGICFQGWAYFGWYGSLADRYFLLRDRKGAVTSFLTMLAYVLVFQFVVFEIAGLTELMTQRYPSLITINSWIGALLIFNAAALCLRMIQRFYFTSRYFGWEHGVLSIPRTMIGNLVNFMAMARAWRQYLVYLVTGQRLVWDKTMHDFPTGDGLVHDGSKLGELLISWHVIEQSQLDLALEKQANKRTRLGRILIEDGWLEEETLAEAVAFQAGLEFSSVTEESILLAIGRFPFELCVKWRVLALANKDDEQIRIAAATALSAPAIEQIEKALGYTPSPQLIVRDRDVVAGMRLLSSKYESAGKNDLPSLDPRVPLLGDILIENGDLSPDVLQDAMKDYCPEFDGPVGAFLISRNSDLSEAIERALAMQINKTKSLKQTQEEYA